MLTPPSVGKNVDEVRPGRPFRFLLIVPTFRAIHPYTGVAYAPPSNQEREEIYRMSRSLNKVMLIGNVGSDPEIRMTPSGSKVAKFSLATNRSYQDRTGQQQERTDWHRLTFFGRLSDIVEQWVTKGDRLYVEGRIEYSQTQDDQGGTRYWTDIVVNEMVMLGSAAGGPTEGGMRGMGSSSQGDSSGSEGPSAISEPDDDLPF
jgi:single-strand DNA-binding protein